MWCVIGGYNYEGEQLSSLRLFMREVDARAYAALLKDYDYVEVDFRDIL